MLIAAAVTLGKFWGAEPHVSPSTEYTGAQSNSWQDTALSLYFLQCFITKTSHKINNYLSVLAYVIYAERPVRMFDVTLLHAPITECHYHL